MSKSRGTFLTARQFLDHFEAEHLRFYYAKLIGKSLSDVDLSFEEFKTVINSELAANVGNFANRVLSFLEKNFGGELKGVAEEDREVQEQILAELAEARREYEAVNLAGAIRRILAASSIGNKYFQDSAPWALIKQDRDAAHRKVGLAVNVVRNLAIALSPVVPNIASGLAERLGFEISSWDQIGFGLVEGTVSPGEVPVRPIQELPSLERKPAREVKITVHPEVSRLGLNCSIARVEGTTVRLQTKPLDRWRKEFEQSWKGLTGAEEPLKATREMYRACGLEAEAPYELLANLIKDGGKLPSLNSAVDVGNVVSLKRLVSVGMHDVDQITGHVHVRSARTGDVYVPLGETLEANLTEGAFVFADESGTVLCWLDAKQGNVTPVSTETNDVLIIASGNPAVPEEEVTAAVSEIAEKVALFGGGQVQVVSVPLFEPELRVARILKVEDHPNADRLYVFQLDVGTEQRQIVAGVRQLIPKEELEGKKIVIVANLEPAVLRGVESNGMFLAASKGKKVAPLTADAEPGTLVAPSPCRVGGQPINIETFASYKLEVSSGSVLWDGRALSAENVPVSVDIEDGAKVR